MNTLSSNYVNNQEQNMATLNIFAAGSLFSGSLLDSELRPH